MTEFCQGETKASNEEGRQPLRDAISSEGADGERHHQVYEGWSGHQRPDRNPGSLRRTRLIMSAPGGLAKGRQDQQAERNTREPFQPLGSHVNSRTLS